MVVEISRVILIAGDVCELSGLRWSFRGSRGIYYVFVWNHAAMLLIGGTIRPSSNFARFRFKEQYCDAKAQILDAFEEWLETISMTIFFWWRIPSHVWKAQSHSQWYDGHIFTWRCSTVSTRIPMPGLLSGSSSTTIQTTTGTARQNMFPGPNILKFDSSCFEDITMPHLYVPMATITITLTLIFDHCSILTQIWSENFWVQATKQNTNKIESSRVSASRLLSVVWVNSLWLWRGSLKCGPTE